MIANNFARDLLVDPATRGVDDVRHSIVAVASSTSQERAQQFITSVGADASTAKAYGNYEDFVKDDNIDIVYVATPHNLHYDNVLTCMEAGRNVCCEVRQQQGRRQEGGREGNDKILLGRQLHSLTRCFH